MGDTGPAAAIALGIGAVSLLAAAVGTLLHRTTGLTGARRLRVMARLAAAAAWGVLPARQTVAAWAAGLVALAGTLVAGVAVTVLVVRMIPPDVPNPTEAYEGFGDALAALVRFYAGAVLSFVAACVVGVVTGDRVASRWSAGESAAPDPAA